jgi:hypothetical protein
MYGVISICLFFAVFVGVLLWTLGLTKTYLKTMRELPLEGEAAPESEFKSSSNPEEKHERV